MRTRNMLKRVIPGVLTVLSSLCGLKAADHGPAPTVQDGQQGPYISGKGGVGTPTLIQKAPLDYPEGLQEARIGARVSVEIIVRADGTLSNYRVRGCLAFKWGEAPSQEYIDYCPAFSDAATRSISRWKYEPATRNGKPVDVFYWVLADFLGPGQEFVSPSQKNP